MGPATDEPGDKVALYSNTVRAWYWITRCIVVEQCPCVVVEQPGDGAW
jgi:hypothetical protein